MKINKLYTLSEFIDNIEILVPNPFWQMQLASIIRYNQFLKQPLIDSMFFNKFGHPTKEPTKPDYSINPKTIWEDWNTEEKKIIFKGHVDEMKYFVSNNGVPRQDMKYWLLNDFTLYDLAEETKGELNLKNVEI